jgi:glycosyltransferase involved in cell wall biosynthesis
MFSVVIPVFNHARYVETAVYSALRSALVSEIVMVDDGSSDASPEIIGRLAAAYRDRIRDLTRLGETNHGARYRLNQLCHAARSEWISVLNSDDEFTAGRFDILRMVIRATRHEFICGGLLLIGENGSPLGSKYGAAHPEYALPAAISPLGPINMTELRRLLCNQNFIATTSNMTFHRDLFRRVGGFGDYRYVHDWDFSLRAAMLGLCKYIASPLTKYRVHGKNTIKELSVHIDGEVVRMFTQLLEDFPSAEEDATCRVALEGNRHLRRYVAPERLGRRMGCSGRRPTIAVPQETRQRYCVPYLIAVGDCAGQPASTYQHLPTGAQRLPRHCLEDAVFCLAHCDYDFLIFSETLDELPILRIPTLRDASIYKAKAAGLFLNGEVPTIPLAGRVVRVQPSVNNHAQEVDVRCIPGFQSASLKGAEIQFGGCRPLVHFPLAMPENYFSLAPSPSQPKKPRVMVLPVFLAVGGVERNLVEVIRALRDRYEFLIITTSRLAKHQGSLHFQLSEMGIRFIDFAELGEQERHISMLEGARRAYSPDLVWICNGSPWLADNAEEIRRIFSHTPIIDQQVYDTRFGWVTRYTEAGIQSFDRFVATNAKIREKFLHEFQIPSHRVDLIYSSINATVLRNARLERECPEKGRSQLGIPPHGLCFAFIGRLTDQKRPLDFLDLARVARDEGFDDHFLLVGSGDLSADCEQFVSGNQLPNVTQIPFYDPLSHIINLIDGIVVTSAYEGLPIALLEALCLGKPALATDVGDIRLILEQYGSGKVVSESGHASFLRSAFMEWRSGLPTYKDAAERSAEAVLTRFSSENIAEQYHASWKSAIQDYIPIRARHTRRGRIETK